MGQLTLVGIDEPPEDLGVEPLAIYNRYPKKIARAKALPAIEKAIRAIATDRKMTRAESSHWLLEQVIDYAKSPSVADLKKTGRLGSIPYPASWMNAGRYDDPRAAWGYKGPTAKTQTVRPAEVARVSWARQGAALIQAYRARFNEDERRGVVITARRWWRDRKSLTDPTQDFSDDKTREWAVEMGVDPC